MGNFNFHKNFNFHNDSREIKQKRSLVFISEIFIVALIFIGGLFLILRFKDNFNEDEWLMTQLPAVDKSRPADFNTFIADKEIIDEENKANDVGKSGPITKDELAQIIPKIAKNPPKENVFPDTNENTQIISMRGNIYAIDTLNWIVKFEDTKSKKRYDLVVSNKTSISLRGKKSDISALLVMDAVEIKGVALKASDSRIFPETIDVFYAAPVFPMSL